MSAAICRNVGRNVVVVLLLAAASGAATAMGAQPADAAGPVAPKTAVTQYNITWTFDKPVPVGQFVTGDYYVVGPVRVVSVDPAPRFGTEIKDEEGNVREASYIKDPAERVRNGSMLNPPTASASGYDTRVQLATIKLAARFPLDMKPGDSLISTISLDKRYQNRVLPNPTQSVESGVLRTAAILTCLAAPVPADTFRPSYCDLKKDRLHRARDIHWERLPSVAPVKGVRPEPWVRRLNQEASYDADGVPSLPWVERFFERPWIDHVYSWNSHYIHPIENMPNYGREVGRAVSYGALMLCTDLPREKKETICLRMVQIGIDNWGVATRSKKGECGGWPAQGGFGNGRKLPIVLAALLLDDEEMKQIRKYAGEASFGEDEHTEFGPSWTGAAVRFAGQYPLIGGKPPYEDRGPYEHLTPDKWPGNNKSMSEAYRRCCTSSCWIGQALAVRLMKAEKLWDHDAFFAYVDRWTTEDDAKFLARIKQVYPKIGDTPGGTTVFDSWIDAMWDRYRPTLQPPAAETWKRKANR